MYVQPYLFFEGRCEEALEFYRKAIGAEVKMMLRFKDNPEGCPEGMLAPGTENKVMHTQFHVGDTVVMASDGRAAGNPSFQGFALTLAVANDDEAKRRFAALGEGGEVRMPLGKTFFASSFGMVADRFGVTWMVIALPQAA